MQAILFDLDGVIYQGDEPIAGAAEAINWVRAEEIPHLFVTNTTSKPRTAIAHKLQAMGIVVDPAHILSPPVAAANWLMANTEGEVALFVPGATQAEFDGLPLWQGDVNRPVAAVVLGDLGEDWNFERLNQAFRLLMQKPAPGLVALGMTRYWRAPEGLRLDTGPFVTALSYATGTEPLVLGKPSRDFFQLAAGSLQTEPAQTLMIGDDIRGDVEGAQHAGLKGALVKTGKFQPQDLDSGVQPDAVLESVADLPAWWSANT